MAETVRSSDMGVGDGGAWDVKARGQWEFEAEDRQGEWTGQGRGKCRVVRGRRPHRL